jgi:murein DD-endopeptidase MepM/ murein hydrolase activator NlpD
MKQQYFVVVLAHSLHGRLRRIHIPHQALYVVLGLALFGSFSLFGMVSSYLRMVGKVAQVNSLRSEVDSLRDKYRALQQENDQKGKQLVTLQLMASEVSLSLGLKRNPDGSGELADDSLVPSYDQSVGQYNFLKLASVSRLHHNFPQSWQLNVVPSMWPVNGRLMSRFGDREDPFSGEGAFHKGVDISAPMGTPVHAAADGVIYSADFFAGYGRVVVIDHGHGMQTWYAHLSRFDVIPGEEIRRGEVLGFSGASGKVTAPHLHFEVRVGGTPVNPYKYLVNASAMVQQAPSDLPF